MVETPEATWEAGLAQSVGRQVARFRSKDYRNLTAQQLSDELRDRLGFEMKRTVIGNLESGYRRTISLAEILALAYVLSVPPLLLMAPVGEEFEIVPGAKLNAWYGASWITGEGVPPHLDQASADLWDMYEAQMNFLGLYRQHHALLDQWLSAESSETADAGTSARRQQEIEKALALVRWTIRERGAKPPYLPGELQGLDQRTRPPGEEGRPDA